MDLVIACRISNSHQKLENRSTGLRNNNLRKPAPRVWRFREVLRAKRAPGAALRTKRAARALLRAAVLHYGDRAVARYAARLARRRSDARAEDDGNRTLRHP